MPIFMDRHDVSEEVTAVHVAQLHQEDLKIEHKFNCKGLTYWFDEKRKMAFCLLEAPNKQSVHDMHNHAHGELPHRIIEVDENVVESFLGRIKDPKMKVVSNLKIINDSAFRVIMVLEYKRSSLRKTNQIVIDLHNFNIQSISLITNYEGNVVKQSKNKLLVSFTSVSNAVNCARDIQLKFEKFIANFEKLNLKISLCGGVPVTNSNGLFEDSIKFAERICNTIEGEIIISSEVKELFNNENLESFDINNFAHTLSPSDENFLNSLLDYTEQVWNKTDLKIDDFCSHLGFSKSQLYRKMIALTNKSTNKFIKEYRLENALRLLNKQEGNISEIAFETGFNSPTYFSKCFKETYGVLPSSYTKKSVLN